MWPCASKVANTSCSMSEGGLADRIQLYVCLAFQAYRKWLCVREARPGLAQKSDLRREIGHEGVLKEGSSLGKSVACREWCEVPCVSPRAYEKVSRKLLASIFSGTAGVPPALHTLGLRRIGGNAAVDERPGGRDARGPRGLTTPYRKPSRPGLAVRIIDAGKTRCQSVLVPIARAKHSTRKVLHPGDSAGTRAPTRRRKHAGQG